MLADSHRRWLVPVAFALLVLAWARPAAAQSPRQYFDGVPTYVQGGPCIGSPTLYTLSGQYVGYYGTADVTWPRVGDIYYVHVVVFNLHPCQGIAGIVELGLPPATQFAISGTNPVYCWYTNAAGVTTQITIAGGCPQAPTAGLYGSRFNPTLTPFTWPLAPGTALEIQVPVVSSQPLSGIGTNSYLYGYVSPALAVWSNPNQGVFVAPALTDTTPPDTTISSGPSGLAVGSTLAFTWTGSDNTTPVSGLVYSYRLDPLESAYSSFGSATSRTYSNVPNGNYTLLVKARDAAGNEDPTPASRSVTVNAGLVMGVGSGGGGWLQTRVGGDGSFASQAWTQVPWASYNLGNGEVHPAMGDIDGDGLDEIVVGFGQGGNGWIAVLDDAQHNFQVLKWIQLAYPAYNSANGAVYPAVGDIDGDGRAEIVAGLGSGGQGWWALYDDASTGYALLGWRQIQWPAYNAAAGATHPAIVNIDADARAEIVFGLGSGSNGWLEVFDDTTASYAHRAWIQIPWMSYNTANGETWPAGGNLDADAEHEIVVGLGTGSNGWLIVLDGASGGYAPLQWIQVSWAAYNTSNGTTHPAVGNLDGDAQGEIVIGLGAYAGNGGWFEVRDDGMHGYSSLGWRNLDWSSFRTAGGATFPAVKR